MPDELTALLIRQDRVLTRLQFLAAGGTPDAWRHRLRSGRWQLLGPGVAVAHSGEPTPLQVCWAAVVHCGTDAALAGDAALVHLGATRLTPQAVDVAIPLGRRAVCRLVAGQQVQPRRLERLGLWTAGHPHLRVVHAHASVLHAAAWADDDEQAEHRVTLAVQQRLTTPAMARLALAQMPRLRRRALVAEVLDDVEHGATAQSERDFLSFCRRHGLPLPDALQLSIRTGTGLRYVDGHYRRQRVLLEVDGAHHRSAEQWEADTMRSLELAVARHGTGEQLVRLTRAMLRHQEQRTAELLRRLLT